MQDSPQTPTTPSPEPNTPFIYQLTIERFRGIAALSWQPGKGVNLILGGGDVGKTSVLDAIGLLLSPTNPTTVLDTEYYGRDVEAGFSIDAVFSLPLSTGINFQMKPSWPWKWNGSEVVVPGSDDGEVAGEPVYRLRVRGTEHLELVYEIVQPDGSNDLFPATLRRAIGLVRLSGDDRNDRDLRLVQGSALDRLLADKGYRSRLASELAETDVKEQLEDRAKNVLQALDVAFQQRRLPDGLDLAITGGQGLSITALIGLTANRAGSDGGDVQLPLASWGAGTRRIAALEDEQDNSESAGRALIGILGEALRTGKLGKQVPSLVIKAGLHAGVRRNRGRQFTGNDLHDFGHATAALAYCDYFATDKKLRHLIVKDLKFDEQYEVIVVSEPSEFLGLIEQI